MLMSRSPSTDINIAHTFVPVYWGKSFKPAQYLMLKASKALLFHCCEFYRVPESNQVVDLA